MRTVELEVLSWSQSDVPPSDERQIQLDFVPETT